MDKLIKKYIKKDEPEILHDIRVSARKRLANLQKEGKTDKSLKKLLKNSSKLRDTDVLFKICKSKKIKKHLKKRKEKLRKEFIKFLKHLKPEIIPYEKEKITESVCKELLKKPFLGKNDEQLHNIRVKIKKCRYAYGMNLKKIQDYLGKAHDFYNCEKLLVKFHKNTSKASKKKLKYIKRAEKERKNQISTLESSS